MKTSATNRKIRILLTAISNKILIPRPEFQRRLVWANSDKIGFLKTVLEGYPFPEIYIAAGEVNSETGEGIELLVDGQQRISTLFQYFKGSPDLKLNKEIPAYQDLKEEEKISFLEYEVVVRDLGKLEIRNIIEIFKRINSTSYSLNAMELHNARFDGALKKFAEEVSQNNVFELHHIFTPNDIRRMHDLRYTLGIIVSIISNYYNRDEALEEYLEKYNEEFDTSGDLKNEINNLFITIQNLGLPENCRAWKKTDFFTLSIELHRALVKRKLTIDVPSVKERLVKFYNLVDSPNPQEPMNPTAERYSLCTIQGSNDRSSRILRGEIIQKIIDPSYDFKLITSSYPMNLT